MKKVWLNLGILIVIAIFLAACGSKVDGNKKEEENNQNEHEAKNYEIVSETYIDGDVKIDYPQMKNFWDEEKEKEINTFMKEQAIQPYLETIKSLESDQQYEADGSYEIKLKDDLILSIAYSSYNNVTPSAHPFNLFFTTNIDLETGKALFLSDLVHIDQAFVEKLKKAKYVGEIDSEYEEQIRESAFGIYNNDEELISALTSSKDGKNYIYTYITENTLGVSMPVAHAAGDHAEFEMNLNEINLIPQD